MIVSSSSWVKRRIRSPHSFIANVASSTRRFVARAISASVQCTLTWISAAPSSRWVVSKIRCIETIASVQTWSFRVAWKRNYLTITAIPLLWIIIISALASFSPLWCDFPRSILSQVRQITHGSDTFKSWGKSRENATVIRISWATIERGSETRFPYRKKRMRWDTQNWR